MSSSIAKALAEQVTHEAHDRPPPHEEHSLYALAEPEDDLTKGFWDNKNDSPDDVMDHEGQLVAAEEVMDAFHSKDAAALHTALKSFVALCRG